MEYIKFPLITLSDNHNMNRLEEMQHMKAVKARRKALFAEQFGKMLESWKKENHKKEKDFNALIGVSKNVVTGWKNGKAIPQEAKLKRICEVFGVEYNFFDPFDEFGEDFLFNTRAEALSYKLQLYAQRNGLDDDFYNRLIKIDGFLRLFPFHTPGFNNELTVPENDRSNDFPMVKFEFRDDRGLRKILTEQDIDFIIRIQKKLGSEVLEQFRLEKEKVKKDRLNALIEWNLNHYDLNREEVNKRLYKVDFMDDEPELSEEKIESVFRELAAEHHIRPHITRSEIIAEHEPLDQLGNSDEFRDGVSQMLRHEGYSQEEIDETLEEIKNDKTIVQNVIEAYQRRGFDIID